MSNPLILRIEGIVVPKARPRVAGHAYMPKKYREWKESAIASILSQTNKRRLSQVVVSILLSGKHRQNADSDNIEGSILDALVSAKILVNDNLKHCPSTSCAFDSRFHDPFVLIIIKQFTAEDVWYVRKTIDFFSKEYSSQKSEKSNGQEPQS